MRIFVTGGAGYIGSVCVEELLNARHQVCVYDNLSEGHRQAVDPRATFIEGDLSDRPFLFQTMERLRPDAVMHFAASAIVSDSMINPGKYFRNNVGNGVNLLEACVQSGVSKFIFSSTCAIFGMPSKVPIHEELPKQPVNPYGESKLMFERALEWVSRINKLTYVCLRYFNAAGASQRYGEHHWQETHLIPNVLKVALKLKPHVDVYGADYPTKDGTCIRDYVHILDLAQAHMLALECDQSDVFNLGSGTGYSVLQIIETARQITGHSIPVVAKPPRPGDPPRLIADSRKIRKALGWEPRYDNIEAIIESAWNWQRAHPKGYR
ncbi:MAG: UDP-glucose 4-epimerase GalE [Verrucomicrobia bacterium]|nr:UDP-glucose 4-epimerase GalE [Verrucomicrobiota bacterium]